MAQIKTIPTLKQLRHLIALADHGHFGRAAESCLITQSSLSASIKELEAILGRVLIERTRRSVRLTPLAEEVVARARDILVDVEDIVDLVAAVDEPLSGSLQLGVIPTIAPFLLPRVLPTLRKSFPDLKLYLTEDQSSRLLDGLNGGSLDLLLLAYPYPSGKFEDHIFADDGLWVTFNRNHYFSGLERVTTQDLESESLLLLSEGNCLRDHILSYSSKSHKKSIDDFQATSLNTLVQMVENGLGLTVLPKMAIDSGIIRGTGLQVRPLDGRYASRKIGFCWRKSSPRKEEFKLLSPFFQNELATPVRPNTRERK